MYDVRADGTADLLSVNMSPSTGDGPRNSYPTADGKRLYVVCLLQYRNDSDQS